MIWDLAKRCKVWKTNDLALDKRLRQSFETEKPYRVFPVKVKVIGSPGQPLSTWWTDVQKGTTVRIDSEMELDIAQKRRWREDERTE